jgi:hypothetical protein
MNHDILLMTNEQANADLEAIERVAHWLSIAVIVVCGVLALAAIVTR